MIILYSGGGKEKVDLPLAPLGGDVLVPQQPQEPGAAQEPLEVRLPPQDLQVSATITGPCQKDGPVRFKGAGPKIVLFNRCSCLNLSPKSREF